MRTAAFLYAASISPFALEPLGGGESAFGRALSFASAIPGLERMAVAEGKASLPSGPYPRIKRDDWTLDLLLEEMGKLGEGLDAVFLVWADEPFLDPALASRMLENFRKYRAEYGFADGYPVGLAAEILSPRVIPSLRRLAESMPPAIERDSLFTVIQRDINSFDIETEISPKDLRELRLTLACDSRRDRLLVERLIEAGVKDEATALALIPERLDLLRTLPAFVQVQIVGGCHQACSLCPYPLVGGELLSRRDHMPTERFAGLVDQVAELCGDATIDVSLWGEPSRHPDFAGVVEAVLCHPGLSLIVETSGLGWDWEKVARIAGAGGDRVQWVVSLDACDAERYAAIRGPGWEEASAFAERMVSAFPRSAHVQMLRVRENEDSLEAFWRGWKKKTDRVIVQKYSTFAGFLPQRKVSDLSPLVRHPCWHLKRDMSILIDGIVPLCRDCARNEVVLGEAFSPGALAAAWAAGESYHRAHVAAQRGEGAYPEPCGACDEYYTYNA
jgi:spiro-SPASM protein